MRLVDVVNQVRRKASEGTNFVRYPTQVISQALRRVGQQWYENVQLPGGATKSLGDRPAQAPAATLTAPDLAIPSAHPTAQPPLLLVTPPETVAGLQPGTAIKSRWNSYTVEACLAADQRIRFYAGKTRSDEPVLIKEYQLSDDLPPAQVEERLKAFDRLIELNQKIGHGPDFRIIKLVDAIALPKQQQGYLISKPVNHHTTLAAYLSQHGVMTAPQVREVLRQVLESLRFLHTAYRVQFASGESERGLPHGNLSLDSLLVRQVEAEINYGRQFFIYLSDLELWEHLFYPPESRRFRINVAHTARELGTIEGDLRDLGLIGLRLAGGTLTPVAESSEEQLWCDLADPSLLRFIQRLLGLSSPFNTAEEALHTLLQLPEPSRLVPAPPAAAEDPPETVQTRDRPWLILAIALLALGGLGWLAWLIGRDPTPNTATSSPSRSLFTQSAPPSKINEVQPAPSTFSYVVEPGGAWHYAIARQFTSNAAPGGNAFSENLLSAIADRHQGVDRIIRVEAQGSDVSLQLGVGDADVALMSLSEPLSANLEHRTVAFDALVVFVPFSDPHHFNQTTAVQKLNRSITIEQLRQLYTSDTDTPTFPGQDFQVRLFFSEDAETVRRFEVQVLGDNSELKTKFQQLRAKVRQRDLERAAIDRQPWDVYNRMWVDFNRRDGDGLMGIGFDRLGRMYDQCSVYPLEISDGISSSAQVLVQSNGQPIDQNTDLCGAKGSYFPDLQNYPAELKYELGVVFPKGSTAGPALANMLETTEGQYLMSEIGLIPTQPVPTILSQIWGYADD